jgi:hypothetical protein
MNNTDRFSTRHGLARPDAAITIRKEAPEEFRRVLVDLAYEAGLDPSRLRSIVCKLLRVPADPNNWSQFPNIDGEARGHIERCEWFEVYDLVERIHDSLLNKYAGYASLEVEQGASAFERELNAYFRRQGIGWQLRDGQVDIRGQESFEVALSTARSALVGAGRETAAREIHEALQDLSRRPEPDLSGAVHHALAALECVARNCAGDSKATLGEILKRKALAIPRPLDQAVEKLWGYGSEQGRHLREGTELSTKDVELVVHVAAAVSSYLSRGQE